MSTYAFREGIGGDVELFAPEFARPIPTHAQSAEAADAVEAVRREGRASRLQRAAASLVTDHGRAPIRSTGKDPVTANARKLAALAEANGFEVKILSDAGSCRVEGHHAQRRQGFTASWVAGRATVASWHEPWRYAIVEDKRSVKVNALTRTALAGHRAAGVGTLRLALLGSPLGLPLTHTALAERIQS